MVFRPIMVLIIVRMPLLFKVPTLFVAVSITAAVIVGFPMVTL
jgi:hypothetical protein